MSKKTEKGNPIRIEGYDYLGNSASVTDCTGLIPSAPLSKAERDSYEEIYHYQPKAAPLHQTESSYPASGRPQNPA